MLLALVDRVKLTSPSSMRFIYGCGQTHVFEFLTSQLDRPSRTNWAKKLVRNQCEREDTEFIRICILLTVLILRNPHLTRRPHHLFSLVSIVWQARHHLHLPP